MPLAATAGLLLQRLIESKAGGAAFDSTDCSGQADLELKSRLLFKGVPLRTEVSLEQLGIATGSTLRLLPGLRERRRGPALSAPRGLLMTPGNRPWAPSLARAALIPLPVPTDAPYSANLVHPILVPHPPLPLPA